MLYKFLKQTHPAMPPHDRGYDAKVWAELDDLFRGGYQILEHAAKYLPKAVGEKDDRYEERLRLAAYIGYFSQIVNVYVAAIFEQPVMVAPAGDAKDPETPGELPDPQSYNAFAEDADLRGCAFAQVLRHVTTWALVKQKCLLAIDFPRTNTELVSRADSDTLGAARPYCYAVEPETLINWEVENEVQRHVDLGDGRSVEFTVGNFAWVVLKKTICAQPSPDVMRAGRVEEYRIWRKTPDGRVIWQVYRTPPIDEGQKLKDDQDIPMVDESPTTFREIPLVELKLPENLWLGNLIGPLNKEHWQRRSALLAAQQRNLLAVPVINLGPETNGFQEAIPSEAQQDPNRAHDYRARLEREGAVILGKDDKFGYASPDPGVYTVVDGELDKLVDEIYRVSGQMASSVSMTGKGVARSGASKALDRKDFVTVVSAIAAIVSDAGRRCYEIISEARGEEVKWCVHGLDGYEDDEDRQLLLEEALQADALEIPSPLFRSLHKIRTALGLVRMTPQEQGLVRQEILAATTAEETMPAPKSTPEEAEDEPGATDRAAAPPNQAGQPPRRTTKPAPPTFRPAKWLLGARA